MTGPPYGGAADQNFHRRYPELIPFDNGEGLFTFGGNRDVEMGELERHGQDLLVTIPHPSNVPARTCRGLLPSAGPTTPWASIRSMSRAARL